MESPVAGRGLHLLHQQQEGRGREEEVKEGIAKEDFQGSSSKERVDKLQEKHRDLEEGFKQQGHQQQGIHWLQ